jgi:hypothetical protein
MKIFKMKIEGESGKKASLERIGNELVVLIGEGIRPDEQITAMEGEEQELAKYLQEVLDGFKGTSLDVATYMMVINQMFAN